MGPGPLSPIVLAVSPVPVPFPLPCSVNVQLVSHIKFMGRGRVSLSTSTKVHFSLHAINFCTKHSQVDASSSRWTLFIYISGVIDTVSSTLPSVPTQCAQWDNAWCLHGGHVVFNTDIQQCQCQCTNGWDGFWCDGTYPFTLMCS